MVTEAKRSIGWICPKCRQPVILERTVFALAAADSRLSCPCGGSAIEVSFVGDRVQLKVPCIFCEDTHTVTCSTTALLNERALAFSCARSGMDCCYVGEEAAVFAAMRRLEEAVDELETAAGAEGTFLNDIVMEEILGELKDIAQRGGISCTCGSRSFAMEVRYSSVELVCAACGGALRVPAATASDIEDLCCKSTLTIRGHTPQE